MNNDRRKLLREQLDILESVKTEIESLKDEEQDYADNMPDNLQDSEKQGCKQFRRSCDQY